MVPKFKNCRLTVNRYRFVEKDKHVHLATVKNYTYFMEKMDYYKHLSKNRKKPINHKFYVGDKVVVMSGRNKGNTYTILHTDTETGSIILDEPYTDYKFEMYGRTFFRPFPRNPATISLLDPIKNLPTKIQLIKDEKTNQMKRVSVLSSVVLPIPFIDFDSSKEESIFSDDKNKETTAPGNSEIEVNKEPKKTYLSSIKAIPANLNDAKKRILNRIWKK